MTRGKPRGNLADYNLSKKLHPDKPSSIDGREIGQQQKKINAAKDNLQIIYRYFGRPTEIVIVPASVITPTCGID